MIWKIVTFIVVFFLTQILAMVAVAAAAIMGGQSWPIAFTDVQLLVISGLGAVLCAAWFAWRRWSPVGLEWLRKRQVAVLAWTLVAALGTMIPSFWLQDQLAFLPDLAGADLERMLSLRGSYFVVALLVPLSEEMVFRGAVLRVALSHSPSTPRGVWTAIALSALLFAAAHMNPAQVPHAFLLGLLLGWLYARTGSILPGLVVHVVNNTVSFLLVRAYPHMPDLTLEQLLGGSRLHVGLSLLFSLCLLVPALFQLNERMRR